jgi:hypothetical protein
MIYVDQLSTYVDNFLREFVDLKFDFKYALTALYIKSFTWFSKNVRNWLNWMDFSVAKKFAAFEVVYVWSASTFFLIFLTSLNGMSWISLLEPN